MCEHENIYIYKCDMAFYTALGKKRAALLKKK